MNSDNITDQQMQQLYRARRRYLWLLAQKVAIVEQIPMNEVVRRTTMYDFFCWYIGVCHFPAPRTLPELTEQIQLFSKLVPQKFASYVSDSSPWWVSTLEITRQNFPAAYNSWVETTGLYRLQRFKEQEFRYQIGMSNERTSMSAQLLAYRYWRDQHKDESLSDQLQTIDGFITHHLGHILRVTDATLTLTPARTTLCLLDNGNIAYLHRSFFDRDGPRVVAIIPVVDVVDMPECYVPTSAEGGTYDQS